MASKPDALPLSSLYSERQLIEIRSKMRDIKGTNTLRGLASKINKAVANNPELVERLVGGTVRHTDIHSKNTIQNILYLGTEKGVDSPHILKNFPIFCKELLISPYPYEELRRICVGFDEEKYDRPEITRTVISKALRQASDEQLLRELLRRRKISELNFQAERTMSTSVSTILEAWQTSENVTDEDAALSLNMSLDRYLEIKHEGAIPTEREIRLIAISTHEDYETLRSIVYGHGQQQQSPPIEIEEDDGVTNGYN